MGKWSIRKPEPSTVRGVCVTCSRNPQRIKSRGKYGAQCHGCHCRRYDRIPGPKNRVRAANRAQIRMVCDICGFKAAHSCQIDVDHIDGNHGNNAPENLQHICSNCHRLKTYLNRDWEQ